MHTQLGSHASSGLSRLKNLTGDFPHDDRTEQYFCSHTELKK